MTLSRLQTKLHDLIPELEQKKYRKIIEQAQKHHEIYFLKKKKNAFSTVDVKTTSGKSGT